MARNDYYGRPPSYDRYDRYSPPYYSPGPGPSDSVVPRPTGSDTGSARDYYYGDGHNSYHPRSVDGYYDDVRSHRDGHHPTRHHGGQHHGGHHGGHHGSSHHSAGHHGSSHHGREL